MTSWNTLYWPPEEVMAKLSACPFSPARHCQLAPQFWDMGIYAVLVPLTDMLLTDPLPAMLVTNTSSKLLKPFMVKRRPPCLWHATCW
uniref:Uncharacterized protein n=1 Tax=Aegilops tauschii TaxID=37682 RepID=M8B880_AEGTA